MHKVKYSENSLKDLRRIEKKTAQRIIKKIHFFSQQKEIFKYAKPLINFGKNKYRFRIGDYRAICKINKSGHIQILMVLNIKHRKEIYLR